MSGLIAAGIGAGFGNAMSAVGQYRLKEIDDRERAQAAAEAKRETQARELEYRRERDADREETRRLVASERGSGKAGSGPAKMSEAGSPDYERRMLALGDTVPEGERWNRAITTGDTSAFEQERQLAGPTEDGKPLTGKSLPDDFGAILKSKAKILREISDELRLGKDYKDVAEGRRTELGNEVGRGLVSGAMKTSEAGEKISALEGKYVDPAVSSAKVESLTATAAEKKASADLKARTNPNIRGSGGARAGAAPADKDAASIRKQVEGLTSKIAAEQSKLAKALSEAMGERAKASVRASYEQSISSMRAERSALQASLGGGAAASDNRPTLQSQLRPGETRAIGGATIKRLN